MNPELYPGRLKIILGCIPDTFKRDIEMKIAIPEKHIYEAGFLLFTY